MENYIFGIRAVIEAVKSGKEIDRVFVQKGLKGELFSELRILLEKEKIFFSVVPVEKLNRLTKKNHQGIIAQIPPITYHNLEDLVMNEMEAGGNPLFIILDHLSDVRNVGAIIRTAECTGVSGVILPKRGTSITADTIKTSAGAAFRVPICKVENLVDAIYYLQGSGVRVVAASEKSDKNVFDASFSSPLAIVMGAEDTGVSQSVLRVVDERVKLPMFGEIGSLNVSVACGVFLYEAVRQRLSEK